VRIIEEPDVFLIAHTDLDADNIEGYLVSIGDPEWRPDNNVEDGENLISFAGKACYRSWEAFNPDKPDATNPNVSKVRDDPETYVRNILKSGHGSVLEHTNVSFMFKNVSRVFTHELVRHRAGCAYSQESLRFVRLTDLTFWIPRSFTRPDLIFPEEYAEGIITNSMTKEAQEVIKETVQYLESAQKRLNDIFHLDSLKGQKYFGYKKKLTSAFRRIAPIGLSTAIVCTMNLRAARHIIGMRSNPAAEEEIQLVFNKVGEILKEKYPLVFQDMTQKEDGTWTFEYPKV
jgi:thymidylate synthase (FAD)